MACYGDLVSLKDTIARLLQSSKLGAESRGIIEFTAHGMVKSVLRRLHDHDFSCGLVAENENDSMSYDEWKRLNSFDEVLKRDRSGQSMRTIGQRMNVLDAKMREAARELEDALETHLLDHHHQLDRLHEEKLKQDIYSFHRKVVELKDEYDKDEAEEEAQEDRIDDDLALGIKKKKKKKMVGYSDVLAQMKDELLYQTYVASDVWVLVGMAGIGKTALARHFFDDPQVSKQYDYRVWVTVGPNYQFIDILKSILNQLNPGNTLTDGDELISQFYETMDKRLCIIVLDDVWNKEIIQPVIDLLRNAKPLKLGEYRNMLLVTSRLENICLGPKFPWSIEMIKIRFMNKDESWDLLRDRVFGEDDWSPTKCTPELVKIGKKIAENCEGLPLTIITVADILSKDDKTMTPEYWNQVAEEQNSVFVDVYKLMSKVLLRSYEFLPRYSKEHFLYLGVFPQKYNIPLSKLALLWGVEGCFLLEAYENFDDLQGHISTHMEDLIGKNLVLVRKTTFRNKNKTYGLHSSFWHSCVGEASKNKFFHVFNKYTDILEDQHMRNQRRLCVHNNVLFAIKGVRNSMASILTARSLLCTGPHHQYPVPVCFNHLRWLRVIEALTIRFYEFPAQVVELVRLRYLALTCDASKIPTSISMLSNLEILIVHRYLNIVKLSKIDESSYLPMEIWDMKELKHLQVMGNDLPEPRAGVVLPNLITLLDANARSCTKGVLKGLPKLKKLGIRVELSTDNAEPLCISYHHNTRLESIKCVVVNPVFRWSPIVSSLLFPNNLNKLSLNGLGCPWEDINEALATLPFLCVLKLRCYAFRGAKWETPKKGFRSLEFLLIEDTDLVHWTVGEESFWNLQCIVLKQCYKLQNIQSESHGFIGRIELVDCSPSVVACVKQMQEKSMLLKVFVNYSWDDDGKKLKSSL